MSAVGNSGNTPNIGSIRAASNVVGASGVQQRTIDGLAKIPSAKDAVTKVAGQLPSVATGIATAEAALAA